MKETKKVIRQSIEDALAQAIVKFELLPPSKKIKKLIADASKKIGEQLRIDLKKKVKKESRLAKAPKKIKKA